jgi:hypothetical protein
VNDYSKLFNDLAQFVPDQVDMDDKKDHFMIALPTKLQEVHNVFHVSQLKRCLKPLTDVVIEDIIPSELDLTYKAYPIKALNQQD